MQTSRALLLCNLEGVGRVFVQSRQDPPFAVLDNIKKFSRRAHMPERGEAALEKGLQFAEPGGVRRPAHHRNRGSE